jgi:hypothetical protein
MMSSCTRIHHVLLLILISVVNGFEFYHNVDFLDCYPNKIQKLNKSNCAQDELQRCIWNSTGSYSPDPSRAVVSLGGCERLCGTGFDLWPARETLARFILWVVPAIILLVHFRFAPLSLGNVCAVIAHLVGNPVDSLLSMLTRQELYRRLKRRARKRFGRRGEFFATIWATYDELGWQEASTFTEESIERRSDRSLSDSEWYLVERGSYRLSCIRSENLLGTWAAILGLFAAIMGAFIRTWINKLNNQTSHTIAVVMLLSHFIPMVLISGNTGAFRSSSAAIDVLQELRRDLKAHYNDPLFPPLKFQEDCACKKTGKEVWINFWAKTWWKKWGKKWQETSKKWEETWKKAWGKLWGKDPFEDFEAVKVFEPFDDSEAVDDSEADGGSETVVDSEAGYTDRSNIIHWPGVASCLGMNSPWRPCKTVPINSPSSKKDRGPVKLWIISMSFVVVGSWAPAFYLSYHSGNTGIGCRCVAWTTILFLWLISWSLDYLKDVRLFRYLGLSTSENLWNFTVEKDSLISLLVVGIIVGVQLGLLNNCWCLSGSIYLGRREASVDLGPATEAMWRRSWKNWLLAPCIGLSFTVILVFFIEYYGNNTRKIFCKTSNELHASLLQLEKHRENLLKKRRKSLLKDQRRGVRWWEV